MTVKWVETRGIRYLVFESFEQYGVIHGFITRSGGVSKAPWDSLNLGGTTGDDVNAVHTNHRRLFQAFQRKFESIFDVWQVHGSDVICTQFPRSLDQPHQKADAILTDIPDVTLLMRFADCVPILFYDPVNNVGGIAHAGWQGTVQKIPRVVVNRMGEQYGSRPENIIAGIGPSIGPADYEVGDDFIGKVEKSFNGSMDQVILPYGDRIHFDLWKANQITLLESGVEKIDIANISTFTHTGDWYSHRREHGKTGRFGTIFALPEK